MSKQLALAAKHTKAWACYDCGKCTATCPLARAGAKYSPRRHVLATNLREHQEIATDPSIFTCLSCAQCDHRCPADVGFTNLVLRLRELAYDAKAKPDCPHGGALQSVMRMMAQGGTQQDRLGWLDSGLETDPKQGKVLYWVGCAPYYDAFFPELQASTLNGSRAAVRLFNAMGVTPVVSGEERCCGHDLLWNGDRAGFEALAKRNIDMVAETGAICLVTSCAECLRTWKVDYQPFYKGVTPRILHISEYLAENMDELDLKNPVERTVTYQDPCRMGRHLGIYDPPRQVLEAVPGLQLTDMRRSRANALCCAGGTWSSCDRYAKQVQTDRLREVRGTGAEMLVTACPKCQIHFQCTMRDPKLGEEISIEMRDVAELVAEAL